MDRVAELEMENANLRQQLLLAAERVARQSELLSKKAEKHVVSGNQDYLALLDQMATLHSKKVADYGTDSDPFANIRASSDLGVSPLTGCLLRASDKWTRIKTFMTKGNLVNESFRDSLVDMAAYLLIAVVLHDEKTT